MESSNTQIDFLDDLSPLSQALVQTAGIPPLAYTSLPASYFTIINGVVCFKLFETRSFAGMGDANLSRTLEQIRVTTQFRDLCSIVWDNSDSVPLATRKKNFFYGKRNNLQIAWEYSVLSKIDLEDSGEILDEGDNMIVQDFKQLMEFYNHNKTFKVCDDECFMDIFRFYIDRDMMLEATILAERELAIANREEETKVEVPTVNERNKETEIIDRMIEEEIEDQSLKRLSKAEKFYLDCTPKNPKDIWNKFTVVDNSSFEFSKINTLLNQKSKNVFSLEKKKGDAMQCFGLIFTEDTSFKNWLNHKPEDLGFILPKSFEELENFSDGSNLEVFRCLDKEAINYETNALHLSAHMFFERQDVKQKFVGILQDFAFKSGANKKVVKLCTTHNKKTDEEFKLTDSSLKWDL